MLLLRFVVWWCRPSWMMGEKCHFSHDKWKLKLSLQKCFVKVLTLGQIFCWQHQLSKTCFLNHLQLVWKANKCSFRRIPYLSTLYWVLWKSTPTDNFLCRHIIWIILLHIGDNYQPCLSCGATRYNVYTYNLTELQCVYVF